MMNVGERLGKWEAIYMMCHGEFVAAILGSGSVHAFGTDAGHETLGENRVKHTETGSRPDIHPNPIGMMLGPDLPYLFAYFRQRLFPGNADPLLPYPLHGVFEPVRRAEEFMLLQSLRASEAAGGDMCIVGADLNDLVSIEGYFEAAEGFANAAKGMMCGGSG
jgi:hypothetical protein